MAQLEIKPNPRMRLRVFVVLASAATLALILTYLLAGGTADFFARRTNVTAYMPDAAGLAKDDEVRLNGIRIGKVRKVELSTAETGRPVRAEIRVLARYLRNIPEDSRTAVSGDTIVAPRFLEILPGRSAVPIRDDGVLRSEPVRLASDRANQLEALHRQLTQVDQIFTELLTPGSQSGWIFMSEELYDSTLTGMNRFDQGLHTVLSPQSDLGKAFYTLEFYQAMEDFFRKLDQTLAAIQNGEGALGRMFASDDQYNGVLREVKDLRTSLADANAGKGKWGDWLTDDTKFRQFTRMLASLDRAIASFNAGEGRGQLLANPQLYESLEGSLRRLETVLHDFRTNPRKYLRVKPFGKNPMAPVRTARAKSQGQAPDSANRGSTASNAIGLH